jgi:hypothetical protein
MILDQPLALYRLIGDITYMSGDAETLDLPYPDDDDDEVNPHSIFTLNEKLDTLGSAREEGRYLHLESDVY